MKEPRCRCKCGHIRVFRFCDTVPAAIRARVLDRARRRSCYACDPALADELGILPAWIVIEDNTVSVRPPIAGLLHR